jgi:hypothetical protein
MTPDDFNFEDAFGAVPPPFGITLDFHGTAGVAALSAYRDLLFAARRGTWGEVAGLVATETADPALRAHLLVVFALGGIGLLNVIYNQANVIYSNQGADAMPLDDLIDLAVDGLASNLRDPES